MSLFNGIERQASFCTFLQNVTQGFGLGCGQVDSFPGILKGIPTGLVRFTSFIEFLTQSTLADFRASITDTNRSVTAFTFDVQLLRTSLRTEPVIAALFDFLTVTGSILVLYESDQKCMSLR